MGKDYTGLATTCQILSCVAIPLLLYFGYLGFSNSKLLEIPEESKAGAAYGCWGAAAMYAGTLALSITYKSTRSPVMPADPNVYAVRTSNALGGGGKLA